MRLKTLYLQKMLSVNGRDSLRGRQLYDRFLDISDDRLLGHFVLPDDAASQYKDPKIRDDIIPYNLIKQLDPNLIYIEGGLFVDNNGWWKIPRAKVEELASAGAVVIIADADCNELTQHKLHYKEASSLFLSAVDYGEKDSPYPVYGSDSSSFWGGYRQIVCKPEKMVISEWLRPIYSDVSEILVSLPARLRPWQHYVASGNRDSTGVLQGDLWVDQTYCCPFASAANLGLGYVVFVAGNVSSDVWLERCPDNVKWLTNLGEFLVEDAARDRTRASSHLRSPFVLFLSHKGVDKAVVEPVATEIKRRGVATWFDKERLVPSDSLVGEINRGLEQMTHFVLFWSEACVGAPWVEKELKAAVAISVGNKLPILIVRLDHTAVPPIVADTVWVEASGMSSAEIGKSIVDTIERLAKRGEQ